MEARQDAPDPAGIMTPDQLRLALMRLAGARHKIRTVAHDAGMSPSSISELFAGKRRITLRAVTAIAGAYAPQDTGPWIEAWYRVTHQHTPPPRELPTDPQGFVGREAELAVLDGLLHQEPSSPSPRLVTIVGTAGVGKTGLAVHWGHLRQNDFPDGSLYVDLRGYDLARPVDPAQALAGLLRSLGVQDAGLPVDVDERSARYRTLLAQRRLLVVLDNARDSEQVRLLLPGASRGVTVITARDSLGVIRDRYGARQLELGVLPHAAGARLLRGLLTGPEPPDDGTVDSVVACCAGLPLALRIAAGLAADRRGGLTAVAAELADDRTRLDLLRDYARDQVFAPDSEADRDAALRRLHTYLLRREQASSRPAPGRTG